VTGVEFQVISSANTGSFNGLLPKARWHRVRPSTEEDRDEMEKHPRKVPVSESGVSGTRSGTLESEIVYVPHTRQTSQDNSNSNSRSSVARHARDLGMHQRSVRASRRK
jgi:hypothetical protein